MGRTTVAHHSVTIGEDFLQALLNVDLLKLSGDFPGGPVVKNLPSIRGDEGLILGLESDIPHDVEQLGPCATTREPAC